MATLEENINQAIADFDDIEAAIEEQGVNVPSGTDTKEYGNLIRSIPKGSGVVDENYNPESPNAQSGFAVAEALAGLPIKYVEGSSNADETTYLRDLESGTYVLKGTFKPFEGSGTVCRFSSNLLVNVVKGTLNKVPTSHIQIFYPVHNVVQFCDITDSTYNRTDIKLNELANVTTVEEMIALANNTAKNLYSNAIKANASGEIVRVDDVSPVEHKAIAKVSGKNLLNADGMVNTAFVKNNDGSFTFTKSGSARFSGFVDISIPANTIVTVSATKIEGTADGFAFQTQNQDGTYTSIVSLSPSKTYAAAKVTDKPVTIRLYLGGGEVDGAYLNISGLQIEIGDTATEYEPYIDPTSVTVTRCGKNLLKYPYNSQQYTETGVTFTVNADGSVLATGTVIDAEDAAFYLFTRDNPLTLPKGTYTISGSFDTNAKLMVYATDWTYITTASNGAATFTLETQTDLMIYIWIARGTTINTVLKPQIECGDSASDVEIYNGTTYTPNADGTVEISSLAPTMTLLTDKEGVNIELEYNQDSNKALENVNKDIKTLDNDMAVLKEDMGDVETALDSIIAIQNSLIGGDA